LSLLFYSCLSGGSSLWMGGQSHCVEYHWKAALLLKEGKCTSQITYNFSVRQSHVRTPVGILAMTAPRDRCCSQPDRAEGSASPSCLYWRVWLWAVPEYHPAISSTSLLQICVCHNYPDGGTAECLSVFRQWEKTRTQSRMGHATVSS